MIAVSLDKDELDACTGRIRIEAAEVDSAPCQRIFFAHVLVTVAFPCGHAALRTTPQE